MAYDTVSRAAFLSKVHQVAQPCYLSCDCFTGSPRCIAGGTRQACVVISARPRAVSKEMRWLQRCSPSGNTTALRMRRKTSRQATSCSHTWMTCTSSRDAPGAGMTDVGCGETPPSVNELGEDVWRGGRPTHERGFTALGVPLGHADYAHAWARRRVQEKPILPDHLPHLPDAQCAWLFLLMCTSMRANHALRNALPEVTRRYAEARDRALCMTLWAC